MADWYLQKVDQCARLARDAVDSNERSRFEAERKAWLQILAEEIGVNTALLETVIALDAQRQ